MRKRRSLLKGGLRLLVYVGIMLGGCVGGCVALLGWYVVGYVVLMRRDMPAVDAKGRFAYRSSFQLAPSVRLDGPLSIFYPAVSPLNVFFEPVDDYWRGLSGFIGGIPENEPFANGELDPGRIRRIRVFLRPPGMNGMEKYEDLERCRRVDVDSNGAAQELCHALSASHSALDEDNGGTTVAGMIEAVIDDGRKVFLYFYVAENSDVYVCHPGSPAHEPKANGHGQNDLLPWLRQYVLQKRQFRGKDT